ncbi:hypothetical protein Q5P01_019909 [Channa striata]|uniref:Uncharacterized protein n=1 Tax=Channa striata TaxID=64152 RepID=A0AA88M286_CHASR|nr:hypothetical protein Q5P01_019909 [Channa striata]
MLERQGLGDGRVKWGVAECKEVEEEETWVGGVGWGGVRAVEVKKRRCFLPSQCRGEVDMAAVLGPDCRSISSVAQSGIAALVPGVT